MNQILKGKNCLITGATGGLGKEIAEEFAKNGCNLFLTGRNNEKLNLLKDGLENNGIKIDFEAADLSDVDDIQKLIDKTKNTFSNIDILVNCAGVFPVKLLSDSTVDDFEKCFSVNVRAAFVLCKEFSQGMISKKWGRIVNIASSGAYNGRRKTSIYRASKHALLGLSRSLHSELKEHNVRTFCVSPGPVKTPMGLDIVKNENPDEKFDSFMNPSEIAEFIAYLISFDSEMVSEEIRLSRID
jgi:3-oxoacyl-[acyl-carrier protein] reductase